MDDYTPIKDIISAEALSDLTAIIIIILQIHTELGIRPYPFSPDIHDRFRVLSIRASDFTRLSIRRRDLLNYGIDSLLGKAEPNPQIAFELARVRLLLDLLRKYTHPYIEPDTKKTNQK
ncbi:hypothetical protein QKD26_gp4 [Wenling triplecross lizardfish paramyxovirus]|uniref:Uncharacterized protein n=1 Tax=Wenling triplecross lizardfish paramyxovirus TaxID=2116451 RepID=A0A2P1GMZ5_9MONO|nr:hypothetical protein QKD26_gp4 [Wenling triplecross lizardfish paramyxovirus]AVM87366.1 hypothetical protein [Wenling triplecross lizardfish paramyxovirus]